MFAGISIDRVSKMSKQELRWLDNVKKGFLDSDELYRGGREEDCLGPMFNAIDAAQKLRRSLRAEDTSNANNQFKFTEFLSLEVPNPAAGGLNLSLTDTRTGKTGLYPFPLLVYKMRCMLHENENLNVAEGPDYHITLDWGKGPLPGVKPAATVMPLAVSGCPQDPSIAMPSGLHPAFVMGHIFDGGVVCNGHLMWRRLRAIMAKFITGIEAMLALSKGERWNLSTEPPMESVRPSTRPAE
jgi:hypothetical protein